MIDRKLSAPRPAGEKVRGMIRRRVRGVVAAILLVVLGIALGLAASSAQAAQRYAPVRDVDRPAAGRLASAGDPFTFVGLTSQFPCQMSDDQRCGQVNVFMSKDMKRVKRLTIGFEAACNASDHYYGANWGYDQLAPPRRSKHNTVASFKGSGSQDDPLDGGLTAHDDTSLSGKVTRGGKGSGTFQTTITIRDPSGQTIDTCSTGLLTYHLSALK